MTAQDPKVRRVQALKPSSLRQRNVLADLFRVEAPLLRRLLRRLAPAEIADDLAQESFARLCAADMADVESPRAFLFKTARNLALNDARHRRAVPMELVPDPDELGAVSTDPSPEEQVTAADALARLQSILDELPPRQRDALRLFKFEGLSHKEIGARLGGSPRTVERYVADAIAHCALALRAGAREE